LKKIAVVDMDDTLAIPRKLTYYLWTISRLIFKLGILLQKRNNSLFKTLKEYDKIIILTGRTERYRKITEYQLRKFGVKPDKIIFCPLNDVILNWKKSVVKRVEQTEGDIEWFDDLRYTYRKEGE